MQLKEFIAKAIDVPFLECGRDWDGWDCWGLVFVAYRELFDATISTLSDDYVPGVSFAELNAVVDTEKQQWIETTKPMVGDVSLFSVSRFQSHVALVIDRGQMIHSRRGIGTVCERLDTIGWAKRHAGYFRHKSRC